MADYGNDYWAIAVNLLTGYPMPSRDTVFDDVTGDGKVPMLNVTIEDRSWSGKIPDAGLGGENVDGHGFVIPFFAAGGDGAHDGKPLLRRAVFDYVTAGSGMSYGDAYWSDQTKQALDGKALGQYIGGSLGALEAIAYSPYSTVGLKLSGASVVDGAAVDMDTFYRAAEAFDRVGKFFVDHAATIKQWQDSLGKENAAWEGKAAGVFKDLIDMLAKNYQSYADQMHPSDFKGQNTWQKHFYTSTTKQGDALIGAGNAVIHEAGRMLSKGKEWASGVNGTYSTMSEDSSVSHLVGVGNPYGIVRSLLDEVLAWVAKHNWPAVEVTTKTSYSAGNQGTGTLTTDTEYRTTADFKQNFPGLGDLNVMSTWQALGKQAVKIWNDGVDSQLVPAAKESLSNVNNAWISAQHVMENVVETKSTGSVGGSSGLGGDGEDTDSLIKQLNEQAQKAIDDANKQAQDAIDKANAAAQAAVDEANKQAKDAIDQAQNEMKKQQEEDQNQLKQVQDEANKQIDDANKQAQEQANQFQQELSQSQQGTGSINDTGGGGNSGDGTSQGSGLGDTSVTNTGTGDTGTGGDTGAGTALNSGLGDTSVTNTGTGDIGTGGDTGAGTGTGGIGDTSVTNTGTGDIGGTGTGDIGTAGGTGDGSTLTGDGGASGAALGNMSSSVTNTGGGSISGGGGLGGGLGGSQGGAGTLTNPDGSTTQTNPDGTKVTTAPDGTVTRVDPDGTTTVTLPDGTVQTQNPDGTVTTQTGDGTITTNNPSSGGGGVSTKYPDGTSTTANPDGTTTVTESDGTTTTTDPGTGQVSTHYPDGTSSVTAPDGTITTTNPDGSTSVSHPDGNTSVTGPDGTVTTSDGHGTTTVRYPDGTSLTSLPDGSTKITGPDGTITKSDGAGTITTTNPDGSTSVTHPDGSVSTSGPTGSTVTDTGSGTVTGGGLGSDHGLGSGHDVTGGGSGLGSGLGTGSDFGSGLTTDTGTGHVSAGLGGPSGPADSASVPSTSDLTGMGHSGAGDGYAYDDIGAGSGDLTGGNPFTSSDPSHLDQLTGGSSAGQSSAVPPMSPGGMGGMGGGQAGNDSRNERVRNSGARGSIGTPGRGRIQSRRAAEEELYEEEEAAFTPGMPYGAASGAGTRPERTATESGDRERSAWVQEDEDVWGTEEGTTPAVIGR